MSGFRYQVGTRYKCLVIIRNFEIKFKDKNYYNYNNITVIYIQESYISSMNEALVF